MDETGADQVEETNQVEEKSKEATSLDKSEKSIKATLLDKSENTEDKPSDKVVVTSIFDRIAEKKILYKNTAEKYQFVVKNSSVIPISGIIFTYDDNISYFTNDFTKEAFRFLPKERVVIDTEIICRFAGGYDAGIEGFYVQDIFGIMRFKRNVKIPVECMFFL